MGCRLWGHTESDTTEATQQQQWQHTANAYEVSEPHSWFQLCTSRVKKNMMLFIGMLLLILMKAFFFDVDHF